jgi:hypothetical protein
VWPTIRSKLAGTSNDDALRVNLTWHAIISEWRQFASGFST